jgi:hypothetical protein
MAHILSTIEDDDDGTMSLPMRRKRKTVIDSDDEAAFSAVPENSKRNPMAPPAAKKRKDSDETRTSGVPSILKLQPPLPEKLPPTLPISRSSQHHLLPKSQIASQSQPRSSMAFQPRLQESRSQPEHHINVGNSFENQGLRRGYNQDIVMGNTENPGDHDDIYESPAPAQLRRYRSPQLRLEGLFYFYSNKFLY